MKLSDYVKGSVELTETDRVMALPKVWELPGAVEWATAEFKKPGGTWIFRPAQAQALLAMRKVRGLLAPIGVGHGKTLISWLAAKALQVSNVVIMMTPRDVAGFNSEIEQYKKHFDEGVFKYTILTYNELSRPESTDLLTKLSPDAIICDEVHNLADRKSVRTGRFLRYMHEHPDTLFVGMSGTPYKKSVTDVAHLAQLALRNLSPMPHPGEDLDLWSRVLDVQGMAEVHEYAWFETNVVSKMDVEDSIRGKIARARKAAYNRLTSSEGVVTTDSASCDMPLTIKKIRVNVPDRLLELAAQVKKERISPDGEDTYASEANVMDAVRHIVDGFYYKWDWNAIGGKNEDWLMRRTAWHRSLSSELMSNARVGYDSPKLISDAVDFELDADPGLADRTMLHFTRKMWNEVKHLPEPPRLAVWLDRYLIDYIVATYKDSKAILWYESIAIEEALAEHGLEIKGAGSTFVGPERLVAASMLAHGQGRNLQAWNHGLVIEPNFGGAAWEQLLGRMHRNGQERPVVYDVLVREYYEDSIKRAKSEARFIEDMSGAPQRLLSCSWVG